SLGPAVSFGARRYEVRLWHRAVRRVHRALERHAGSFLHAADFCRREPACHDDRRPREQHGRAACAAEGMDRARRCPMRLLSGRADHVRGGTAQIETGTDRCGHRCSDGGKLVPLRYLHAHSQSHPCGGSANERRSHVMSSVLRSIASADDDIREILRAAEAQTKGSTFDRRTFLKVVGLASGGLVLAFYVGAPNIANANGKSTFAPNAFIRISPDGTILIYSKGPEIGQGIKTAFPLIVAEELDADWAHVRVEQAPINPAGYGRQSAGGSGSIPMSWDQRGKAGASARAMLVSAAAKEWNVAASECRTASSVVYHDASSRQLTYAALSNKAAAVPVPDESTLRLKTREEYKLLGTFVTGVDNHAIVTGQPLFGIDTVLPNMRYAVFEKCPAVGGKVRNANLDQ